MGNFYSNHFIQTEGVPQGSVLSLTLFIIHLSQIFNFLPSYVHGSLYVDDLQISCQGSNMNMIERQLQHAVNKLVAWCDKNGHTISAEKSRCVHFCRKRNIHLDPNIQIRNAPIPVVNDIRFLGVIFDRELTFLPHILHLRKKCERSLNILKVLSRTSWGADRTSLLRIYQAVILSSMDYGCMVYGSARPTVLRRLDTIHHSALRICSGAFRTSPVESLISSSNETFHSVSPFLVEKAIISNIDEVKCTKKLRSGDLLVEVQSRKQSLQIVKVQTFSNIPVTVSPHATLNSSKGVITCGELLNVPTEEILKELQGQGVSHVRRISIRRDGQLLNTKHLILTFDSAKLPENIKAGYMRLSVRTYIPNPLRCFQCQRFGHSKTSCRGTLTCARCAEVGHESTNCTRAEKCVNCKGEHTSFSRNCFAWKQEKEIISTKIKQQISYQEARKLVKSQTPTPGHSYVSVAKKSFSEPSVQKNPDASAVTCSKSCSKPSDSTAKASPPITNLPIPSSPSVAPVSEEALASPDFTDFQVVRNRKKLKKESPTKTNHSITKAEKIAKFYTSSHREITNPIPTKDNISTHQSTLKPFPTTTPTSVDIELLPMAVLPPLEKSILQSRESDVDAEMSSSSASEEDALEYNMSEDLEDSPKAISPPLPSKPEKGDKYKNRLYAARPSHILPFCERTKMLLHDSDLHNVSVQLSDFFTFPPWEIPQFSFLNPFSGFDKSSTAPVTFQQLFHHHRYQYSSFLPIFTDGSKSDGHVGCGVVSPSDTLSYRLHNCCSVFTAELVAIFCALQEISHSSQRNFIIYTDSMSALETLSHYDTQMHPVGLEILSILQFLRKEGFFYYFLLGSESCGHFWE
ncbi:hypothetical protein AVEN_129476-1 [Araneus ventricosus]|uniref:Reverse transcriptase domain-containing protein n=1 Tax=Araneus ventricosus TaxID=182803 RepID=A0A4Y2V7H0_ARAVE|nr:hypothetical protein AVEN_129476-1 [Araneus ventricosus]